MGRAESITPKSEKLSSAPTMAELKARGWWKRSINATREQNINSNFLCESFQTGVTLAQLKTRNARIQAELAQLSTSLKFDSESQCAPPAARQEPSDASSQKVQVVSIGTPTQSPSQTAPGNQPRASVTGLLAELAALAKSE